MSDIEIRQESEILSESPEIEVPQVQEVVEEYEPKIGEVFVDRDTRESFGVEAIALKGDTQEKLVVYRSLTDRIVRVRSIDEFEPNPAETVTGAVVRKFQRNVPTQQSKDVE
jgi:hypothetical protein